MAVEIPITHHHFDEAAYARHLQRVRLFLALSGAIACAIGFRIATYGGTFLLPTFIFVLSILVGRFMPQLFAVHGKQLDTIVQHLDKAGLMLLSGYLLLEAAGGHPSKDQFMTSLLFTTILMIGGGILLGRGLAIWKPLLASLHENPELHKEKK